VVGLDLVTEHTGQCRSGAAWSLSVVIPALNEEAAISETIAAVRTADGVGEIIVVDGGSDDRTVEIARDAGATVITAARGRGAQMASGARVATGEALWFVHADTLTPTDGPRRIREALADPWCVGGHFEIRFDGDSAPAKLLTLLYRRLGLLGLRYGDSAYFVRRDAYERCGGFCDLPIFEDLDLLRRLRREGRFVRVDATVTTSSRRFAGRSFTLVFARWVALQVLYWLRAPPRLLHRGYADVRSPGRLDR